MTDPVLREAAEQCVEAHPGDPDTDEVIDLLEGLIEDAEKAKSEVTYDELEEKLPQDIYEAVMSHLKGGPESAHETALKAVRGEGYPNVEVVDETGESVRERVEKTDPEDSVSLHGAYRNEEDVD